jgi:serine/threonine protein kinase
MYLEPNKFQDKYPQGKMIGEGAYGSVYESGDFVVKSQSGFNESGSRLQSAIKEVNIFSMISHPCIIQLEDWTYEHTKYELYISLLKGENIVVALHQGKITIEEIQKDLFSAMNFLNKNGIAHCDLKPQNIVFLNGKACIIDFGLVQFARLYREGYFLNGIAYTEAFRDPEYWGNDHNSIKAELYSLAKTLYICQGQSEEPKWNPYNTRNYKVYDMKTGLDWLDDIVEKCSHFPLSERKTYMEIDPFTREEGQLLDTPIVALDPTCNEVLGTIFAWTLSALRHLRYSSRTAFLTIHLIHRTLKKILPNYSKGINNAPLLQLYIFSCINLAASVCDETIDLTESIRPIRDKYSEEALVNLIFIVLQYARGIIHTPTYWDHANFAEDLYPLMKYTLICNYNPNKIPVKLASSGKDKNVEFDFIADQLMSDKYSITKNMGMIPKQYYDHTEAELTKVPEVDRDLAVFYLRDQSVYFNDVFVVGHFHEFLKDMKMLDAIQLYNKMRDISKGGVDSVIAYQVLEKIVGYKPEYIEFESLGLHPFRATWEEIEKAREDYINNPLEAGLNPLRRTKKKWEIDEEKVDYQVID